MAMGAEEFTGEKTEQEDREVDIENEGGHINRIGRQS
jgi:hypothetical protein